MNRFLLSLILGFVTTETRAQTATGNDYLPGCKAFIAHAADQQFSQGTCAGTVMAQMFLAYAQRPETASCPPEGATVNQGVRVVIQFLEANPQRLHESFNWLVVYALRSAWPCKK
jgi:hypothetical protein